MKRTICVACAVIAALGCNRPKPAPEATASASAATTASAAPAAPKQAWYVGQWSGSYESRRFEIKMTRQEGAVREWEDDTGEQARGAGKLDLKIEPDGRATGTASGPLGDMIVSGVVDEDVLTLELKSTATEPAKLFNGVVQAKRRDQEWAGTLQASSGTGLVVRDGTVTLKLKPGDPVP